MYACICYVGLFANFRKTHRLLNKMLPKYVKIWFDDTKKPVDKVKAVESPSRKEHILAYTAHTFNHTK